MEEVKGLTEDTDRGLVGGVLCELQPGGSKKGCFQDLPSLKLTVRT